METFIYNFFFIGQLVRQMAGKKFDIWTEKQGALFFFPTVNQFFFSYDENTHTEDTAAFFNLLIFSNNYSYLYYAKQTVWQFFANCLSFCKGKFAQYSLLPKTKLRLL